MTHPSPASPLLSRRELLASAAGLWWATPAIAAEPSPAPHVMASFSILADMARELAPSGVQVGSLVGPDTDAHVYKPTPADARRLAQARLVIVNGLGFEGWMDRLIRVSGNGMKPLVATQGIRPRQAPGAHAGHAGHGGHGGGDPHAWHDLSHARTYVGNIAAALAERWPGQREEIAARRDDYLARIASLDQRLRAQLAQVPRERRRVLVSHDAFGYLGEAYGIDFLAPQGWTTASEPSAAAVARLIRQVREQRVRAIFVENVSDARLIERIARESGAQVGGTLISDALSAPGGKADSYLRLVEHNMNALTQALRAAG